MNEDAIRAFWDSHPCDDASVGGLASFGTDYVRFFDAVDANRYDEERHILACLDAVDWRGKRVLEIGLGQGSDSEQLIRRGAIWTGLDLTPESVARVRARMQVRGLPHETIVCGTALDMPFPDGAFDMVYSHGVLHHIPEIDRAQREIARVLRPGGELVAMLYAKWSLNYLVAIGLVRRLALAAMHLAGVRGQGKVAVHLEQLRARGWDYLRMRNFIHVSTDGPRNPFSRAYDLRRVRRHFQAFEVRRSYRRFMWAPPLPVHGLPGGSVVGWHLWVHLVKRASGF